jgi:hypothetical protein
MVWVFDGGLPTRKTHGDFLDACIGRFSTGLSCVRRPSSLDETCCRGILVLRVVFVSNLHECSIACKSEKSTMQRWGQKAIESLVERSPHTPNALQASEEPLPVLIHISTQRNTSFRRSDSVTVDTPTPLSQLSREPEQCYICGGLPVRAK